MCHRSCTNAYTLTKILMSFWIPMRISWDSHEKMTFSWEFSNSHENLSRGFLLMRISFFSWEPKAHKNLVRFSWVMRKWHSHEIFSWAFLLVRISFFSRALKAHESLMRFSWENPLTKTLFLLFLMTVSCNSLDQEIVIENVVSWVFSISHESKYSMHARCVSERNPFRSSFFFWTKHVHLSRDEVVCTGTCTCTCNVAKKQLCNDWSSYRLWSWSDRSNSNDSDQVVLRTSFEVISQVRF